MLAYRMMRAINEVYPMAVLFGYIAAFFVAFAFMFVFPPGTLVLLGLGLASLVAVAGVGKLLGMIERFFARAVLNGGACPGCGHRMQVARNDAEAWTCEGCGGQFTPTGASGPSELSQP